MIFSWFDRNCTVVTDRIFSESILHAQCTACLGSCVPRHHLALSWHVSNSCLLLVSTAHTPDMCGLRIRPYACMRSVTGKLRTWSRGQTEDPIMQTAIHAGANLSSLVNPQTDADSKYGDPHISCTPFLLLYCLFLWLFSWQKLWNYGIMLMSCMPLALQWDWDTEERMVQYCRLNNSVSTPPAIQKLLKLETCKSVSKCSKQAMAHVALSLILAGLRCR